MTSVCLGLDVGRRRIGVALSDPEGLLAVPLTTVLRSDTESALQEISDLVGRHNVGCIVVGLPSLLSGEAGEEVQKVNEFVAAMQERIQLPVEYWDERLSTVAAEKMLRERGAKRETRDARRDSLAAALILQGYLDSKKVSQP
ncbi:MAG: Holliday junction resolvase RuvX [Chloroflexi bacterium]|nr:Holliday junction resolvase RuvX [Chloroflexota bacterium]